MKKILFLTMALATILTSCTEDGTAEQDDVKTRSLTFVFEGMGKGGITYAIATDDENRVDDLHVYMFEYSPTQEGVFKKKFVSGEYTLTKTGTKHSLKLENLQAYGTGNKTFYFVANPSPTTDLDATSLTEKQFAELLTEEVAVNSGKAELLTTPLLFTGKTVNPVNPTGTTSETVPMRRRVARFDIVNEYDNFVIEKIFVSDAKLQGYAFANAKGTNSPVFAAQSLREITVNDPSCYQTIDGERMAPHVFYMYPTVMGETTIAIQANLNNQGSELYYIDSDIDIDANYRYKMTVDPAIAFGAVKFVLDYVDWDTDENVDIDKKKAFVVEDYKVDGSDTHANWNPATKTFDILGNTATKLTFTARNAMEVEDDLSLQEGDWTDVKGGALIYNRQKVFTYAADVAYNYEVTLPEPADNSGGYFSIRLRVSNKANDEEFEDIHIRRIFELPNSYIVHAGEKAEVPVRKGYMVWDKQFDTDLTGAVTAEILWQDSPGGAVVSGVTVPEDLGVSSRISVQTGSTEGNALVALKVDGQIRWTWHIWVCGQANDPRDNTYVINHEVGSNTFMNRNLGAINNNLGNPEAVGMFYQWGRHIPLPGPKSTTQADGLFDSRTIYAGTGSVALTDGTPTGGTGINRVQATMADDLATTVMNPMNYYVPISITQNFFYEPGPGQYDFLWYHEDNSKGYFDPCPEGWRVPRMTDTDGQTDYPYYEMIPDDGYSGPAFTAGTGADYGAFGAYPAGGIIKAYENGSFSDVGRFGYIRFAGLMESGDGTYFGGWFHGFANSMFWPYEFPYRASATPLRCVTDTYPQ